MSQSKIASGSSSVGRASAFQAEGRGFESRLPLLILLRGVINTSHHLMENIADVAQLVEHILGRDEVTGSILVIGSKKYEKDYNL